MDLDNLKQEQFTFFQSGKTLSYNFRKEQLKKLKNMLIKYENDFLKAAKNDLSKPEFETISTELLLVLEEINLFIKKLKSWMRYKNVNKTLLTIDFKSMIINKPFGNSLIISPWNYPIQLTLMPLIGSIAAGNTAIIKPSRLTPEIYDVLYKAIGETFNSNYITVLDKNTETSKILDISFDKVFFTGSAKVGKIVMEKSSKFLSSVTLELGGKSPVVIDCISKNKLYKSLKRIIFGKFINGGQTCVAPDYILVNKKLESIFLETFKEAVIIFNKERQFNKIISEEHYNRIKSYMSQGEIIYGGECKDRSIELTLIKPKNLEVSLMQEEIFGPIFPVIFFEDKQEARNMIQKIASHPLAMYLFSEDESFIYYFLQNISYGGCAINDTISQILNHHLPFGGVGTSGIGTYHGYQSFKCFSKETSIIKKSYNFELPFKYPPYNKNIKFIKLIYNFFKK